VLEELNRFLGQIEPIVDRFRGHIDKYMGDGVMVEFGAPVDYDRHALLAVLAGLRMQQNVKKLNLPWRLRVGIATGSTVVGMLGVRRQAYSAVGDRVNVARGNLRAYQSLHRRTHLPRRGTLRDCQQAAQFGLRTPVRP